MKENPDDLSIAAAPSGSGSASGSLSHSEGRVHGALVVRDLDLRFAIPGADEFRVRADFHVLPGERVAVFSPSGSGKTTLLRWMTGLPMPGVRKFAGTLHAGAVDLTTLRPERRDLGWMPQDHGLFSAWSVAANLDYPLRLRNVPLDERRERVAESLRRLDLSPRANALAGTLSGGERQRVALGRALIFRPRALLLDEPFSALDARARESARQWVAETLRADPTPCLFVTHDESDLERLATRRLKFDGAFKD